MHSAGDASLPRSLSHTSGSLVLSSVCSRSTVVSSRSSSLSLLNVSSAHAAPLSDYSSATSKLKRNKKTKWIIKLPFEVLTALGLVSVLTSGTQKRLFLDNGYLHLQSLVALIFT